MRKKEAIFLFLTLISSCLSAQLFTKSTIVFKVPDFKDTVKLRIEIWKLAPDTSSNDFKKVVDVLICKKRTIINYSFKEAHLSNINIFKNNVEVSGGAFINNGEPIIMEYKLLNDSFGVSGGENKFYQDNQLLLFELPAVIVNDNNYKRSLIKESYEGIAVPPMTMLSVRYKEYEQNIKKVLSANYNKFTVVYKLYNARENISTKTLQECYNLMSKNLQKTYYGKQLLQYIQASKKLSIGKQVPLLKAANARMQELPLNNIFRTSKTTLIHFWATWCIPCIEQMKKIKPLVEKYSEEDFQVLNISLDTDYQYWLSFIKNDSIFKNQFIDTAGFKGNISKVFGLTSIPKNILVDNTGKIIAIDFDKNLIETILTKISKSLE